MGMQYKSQNFLLFFPIIKVKEEYRMQRPKQFQDFLFVCFLAFSNESIFEIIMFRKYTALFFSPYDNR